jgi:indole-3-glycerol phosphate synthase
VVLDDIVKHAREDLETRKRRFPLAKMQNRAVRRPRPVDLSAALQRDSLQLIAEVKKASPSRGVICAEFNPVKIALTYAENNAAAISVLTENRYFQGSLEILSDIDAALGNNRPPLLRKDFIFDPYQIYESRAYGADAVLLIAAILSFTELKYLLELSHALNMKCLVEVHSEDEVSLAVSAGAVIIGINNRDLQTFEVDINNTVRLRPLIPPGKIIVSESGIKTRQDMEKLRDLKVNAALVGESLIASDNLAFKMKELL